MTVETAMAIGTTAPRRQDDSRIIYTRCNRRDGHGFDSGTGRAQETKSGQHGKK